MVNSPNRLTQISKNPVEEEGQGPVSAARPCGKNHKHRLVQPEYLTLADLVTYSSLSERTLRAFISDEVHPLPHYRLSGRGKVVVRVSDFNTWFLRWRTEGPVKAKVNRIIEELRA